ncbi:hypothetical protein PR048_000315 [Dryococelus australis]|uniref:TmcA/NAT10 N-terminal domain-containing protein n=1 Tax=Dryococelus australis TaxID=614101 RepID=A0ABQ9IEG6_9NEOP|nr:hypothetical protein PR048_000315 [Dryococelus australis]
MWGGNDLARKEVWEEVEWDLRELLSSQDLGYVGRDQVHLTEQGKRIISDLLNREAAECMERVRAEQPEAESVGGNIRERRGATGKVVAKGRMALGMLGRVLNGVSCEVKEKAYGATVQPIRAARWVKGRWRRQRRDGENEGNYRSSVIMKEMEVELFEGQGKVERLVMIYRMVNIKGEWGSLCCQLSKGVFRGEGNNNEKLQCVVILHHMLSKATIKARPNVLWCYKKELGFSSHRKKKMKNLQKKIKSGKLNVNEDDPFELFVASTNIRYCYYTETHKILGNTFGMCILQDFEALTPNILARTIETVEGGGLIILLLRSVTSLRQLYTMTMDVHERFRTEAHSEVVARFNERLRRQQHHTCRTLVEQQSFQLQLMCVGQTNRSQRRFLLSLVSCPRCLVMDDQLTVLPLFSHNLHVEAVDRTDLDKPDPALISIKESLEDLKPVGVLVKLCKTADQVKCIHLTFYNLSDNREALTAREVRWKSFLMFFCIVILIMCFTNIIDCLNFTLDLSIIS